MRSSTFLLIAVCGLASAAVLLVLAGALDQPALYVAAVAVIGLVLLARAAWTWGGDLRGWAIATSTVLGTIAFAWLVQTLAD